MVWPSCSFSDPLFQNERGLHGRASNDPGAAVAPSTSRATRRLLAAGALVLTGCDVLPREQADAAVDASLPCQHVLHLEGSVGGVDIDAPGYVLLAHWYNDTSETRGLDWAAKESMMWLG